jgi:signal peptide peptidase SppA
MKFVAAEPLAMMPQATVLDYQPSACPPGYERRGNVACVKIRGPLKHHPDVNFCSYDWIVASVAQALADPVVSRVLLEIDSPGGVVSGAFDCARALREMRRTSNKPLLAFVDDQATSAAYAIACAADEITVPPSAVTGSIGVIELVSDASVQLKMSGITVSAVTSGARKADGHPEIPLAEDAKAAIQSRVDRTAEEFFALVAELRPNLSPDYLRGLEASVYIGGDAVTLGLADRVSPESEFFASVENPEMSKPKAEDKPEDKPAEKKENPFASIRKMLGDLAKTNAAAKKALAALAEDGGEDEDEEAPPSSKAPAAVAPAAEADDADAKAEADDADAKVNATVTALAAQVQTMSAELAAERQAKAKREADAFYTSNAHLAPELAAELRKLPLAQAQAIVSRMGKLPGSPRPEAHATQGSNMADAMSTGKPTYMSPAADEMDRQMGLFETERKVVHTGSLTQFGVLVPKVSK